GFLNLLAGILTYKLRDSDRSSPLPRKALMTTIWYFSISPDSTSLVIIVLVVDFHGSPSTFMLTPPFPDTGPSSAPLSLEQEERSREAITIRVVKNAVRLKILIFILKSI